MGEIVLEFNIRYFTVQVLCVTIKLGCDSCDLVAWFLIYFGSSDGCFACFVLNLVFADY